MQRVCRLDDIRPSERSLTMKTHGGTITVRGVAWFALVTCATAAPTMDGFESGLDAWNSGGHVSILSGAPYQPTEGIHLAAFNSANSPPDGWITREFEVLNDVARYHRLRLDVGNLGFASIPMRLRVEVMEHQSGTLQSRLDQVVTVQGISGGLTRWQEESFDFQTSASGSVTVKLTDVSSGTEGADLVVDQVRIDDAFILTIEASENPWLPDPWLGAGHFMLSPPSIEGTAQGLPELRTNHHPGTQVTLTAPEFHNLKRFLRWRKNGVDDDTQRSTTVTMDADTRLVAVYDPPITASLDPSIEARGFLTSGPFNRLSWQGQITNHSGTDESWSASPEIPDGSPDPVFFSVTPSHGTLAHGESSRIQIHLTREALDLPAGTHYGRVDVGSRYSPVPVSVVLNIIDPDQHVENGSFESDFDGWFPLHHITLESSPPYLPAEGGKLVVFNSVNATPDGSLTRTFPTEPGVTYALRFELGTLSYQAGQQAIQVRLANDSSPAPPPFQTENLFIDAAGDGTCRWESRLVHFVAQGDSTRITFTDTSSTTDAIDLLLDHVRVANPAFNIVVTTAADETLPPPSGSGISLREAIASAAGIPGSHAIRFDASLDGAVLNLGENPLIIDTDLAIDASGLSQGVTLSGSGNLRMLQNHADSTLRHLTITSGGGILNEGSLWMDQSVLAHHTSSESGGAIRSIGDLSLSRCRITDNHSDTNGGGIFNLGSARLEDSSVLRNSSSASGGGLACQGPYAGSWLILDRSTVAHNAAGASGGAYSGIGGYKLQGHLHASNSTFSNNQATSAGGAIGGLGPVELQHCTIADNHSLAPSPGSGGVVADLSVIENSIIAHNFPDLVPVPASPSNSNFLGGDPELAALGPHGGATDTMPPLAGSPVLDRVSPPTNPPSTDQRGASRVSGTAMDLGAVETRQIVVNTLNDETDGIDQGGISLRDAVTSLGTIPVEMIRFAPALDGGTIVLNGSPITLISPSDIAIDASNLPGGISISGNHLSSILGVIFSNTVTLDHLTLRDAAFGALYADECSLKLRHMRFLDNHNPGTGGALYLMTFSALADVEQCFFSGNQAGLEGGAISNHGLLHLLDCTFAGNHSDGNGGALWSGTYRTGFAEIRNSTFSGNTAVGNGGAIHAGSLRLIHSTVCGNTSTTGSGGGVFSNGAIGIENGAFHTTNSIIAGNSLPDFSGVIQSRQGNNLLEGNPKLAPLADYGGPTPTRPPLPGSPAIDSALVVDGIPSNDQRGATRPTGEAPDLGAVEAFPFSTLPPTDADEDGIDDRLEPAYGCVVGIDDSQKDSDGDGSRDVLELANMSDPLDPRSLLRILSFQPAPGFDPSAHPLFDLEFTSFPGLSYTLETSADCQFGGASPELHPLGPADRSTHSVQVLLRSGRDFVRIRRDP